MEANFASEGGDREFNGNGILIVCEAVELQRNPGLTRLELEKKYLEFFNVKKVIWVPRGVVEDNQVFTGILPGNIYTCAATGGHVDEFVRFVGENTILLAEIPENERSKHLILAQSGEILDKVFLKLKEETNLEGKPFEIIRIPMPPLMTRYLEPKDSMYRFIQSLKMEDGSVIDGKSKIEVVAAASYCNFLISNEIILIAKYGRSDRPKEYEESDRNAQKIIQKIFPNHKIVGIDVEALNYGGGGIHCITQQEPL